MKVMVNKTTGEIIDAFADDGARQVPDFAEIVTLAGEAVFFPWPHPNGPSACRMVGGEIQANPAVPQPPPGFTGAQWEIELEADASVPANVKRAIRLARRGRGP
jgi:hypothetical protein